MIFPASKSILTECRWRCGYVWENFRHWQIFQLEYVELSLGANFHLGRFFAKQTKECFWSLRMVLNSRIDFEKLIVFPLFLSFSCSFLSLVTVLLQLLFSLIPKPLRAKQVLQLRSSFRFRSNICSQLLSVSLICPRFVAKENSISGPASICCYNIDLVRVIVC